MRRGGGRVRRFFLWPLTAGACLFFSPLPAAAQNLDEGKSPAQLFAGNCSACHKTPQGLGTGRSVGALAGFLRQHYTTGASSAAALAAYVAGAGPAPASRAASKPHAAPQTAPAAERPRPPVAVRRDERIPLRHPPALAPERHAKPAEDRPKPPAPAVTRRHPHVLPSVESDPAPVAISHEPVALPPQPPTAAHGAANPKPSTAPPGDSAGEAATGAAASMKPDQAGFSSPLP
jgi:hypothetical protein